MSDPRFGIWQSPNTYNPYGYQSSGPPQVYSGYQDPSNGLIQPPSVPTSDSTYLVVALGLFVLIIIIYFLKPGSK